MKAKRYVTKPRWIDAIQWKGDNYGDISDFLEEKCYLLNKCLFVEFERGTQPVNIGCYICRNTDGLSIITEETLMETFEEVE